MSDKQVGHSPMLYYLVCKTFSKQCMVLLKGGTISVIIGQVFRKWCQNVTHQCEFMGSEKRRMNNPICIPSTPHASLNISS